MTSDQSKIYKACRDKLNIENAELGEEFYYNSIVFCVIDSIYSIGANYISTKNVVTTYCSQYSLEKCHDVCSTPSDKHTINDFLQILSISELCGRDEQSVFHNFQRTSTRNGILKAEAVKKIAFLLNEFRINTIKEIRECNYIEVLRVAFEKVKGQNSGLSFSYFMMLSGDDQYIKIDRWIRRFVSICTNTDDDSEKIKDDLFSVCFELRKINPKLTPRLLDYVIWSYSKKVLGHEGCQPN